MPISTGGGKALYVGTYLPADGEYQRVKALLVKRYQDRDLEPGSEALDRVDPTPLFDRVAARYPDLPRDEALGKIGREHFSDYLGDDPRRLRGDDRAQGLADVERRRRRGDGADAGRVIQVPVVLLGARPASACSPARAAGGSRRDGDPDRDRHR